MEGRVVRRREQQVRRAGGRGGGWFLATGGKPGAATAASAAPLPLLTRHLVRGNINESFPYMMTFYSSKGWFGLILISAPGAAA